MEEEPRISSTLRWPDVALPAEVTEADLDMAILSTIARNWLKTARIIWHTIEVFEQRNTQLSDEIVGARIKYLASLGRIESKGDLSMWRHSEVRLPSLPLGGAD